MVQEANPESSPGNADGNDKPFELGQRVECRDAEDPWWEEGVVTCVEPLKIRPRESARSFQFDEVRLTSEDQLEEADGTDTVELVAEEIFSHMDPESFESLNPNLMTIDEFTAEANLSGSQLSKVLAEVPEKDSGQSWTNKWSYFKEIWESKRSDIYNYGLDNYREMKKKKKDWKLNVKESVEGRKKLLRHRVLTNVNDELAEDAADKLASVAAAAIDDVEAERWWVEACAAAHHPHVLNFDAPAPPERAFTEGIADSSGPYARGCLEIEILGFSSVPPITRPDGSNAVRPVCQATMGSRYTGALIPSCSAPSPSSCTSPDSVTHSHSTARVQSFKNEDSLGKQSSEGITDDESCKVQSIARFAIDEIIGCDLRLHVFDSDSRQFSLGNEDQAFCGGALVPVNLLTRRGASRTYGLEGFRCREIEDVIEVKLLPIEVVRKVRKLKPAGDISETIKRSKEEPGRISLRLRLTLYEMVPVQLYMAAPFRGDCNEAKSVDDVGRIDDPMSVLKAAGTACSRFIMAMNQDFLHMVLDDIREGPLSSVVLHVSWSYGMLAAPVWHLPALLLVACLVMTFQASSSGKRAQLQNSPKLYKDEFVETSLSFKDRSKLNVARAVKVELAMMRFARTLNAISSTMEKIRYLVMMSDPYLSILSGVFLLVLTICITIIMGVTLIVFGRSGPAIIIWVCGSLWLLPKRVRMKISDINTRIEAASQYYFPDQSTLSQLLEKAMDNGNALWSRIPDGLEVQHCEIFDKYCLVHSDLTNRPGNVSVA